ncbi:phasin family protein [Wenzhouxiangella sp. XN24]|uniref:phasin family protein n=1 Tax=Wenzhouxiangella sp. XN24 TaxID=2713569 RepID=UPI0013EB590F|nr:phasin family protein [Wenzhouxiangella sp. XN24]NGX17432.1 phasin family protein [Wenzhouxiangella sp. XN24]
MSKNNGGKSLVDNPITRLVRGSANQVWHAGRGAVSMAETEGGRLVGGLLNIGGRIDRGAKSRVYEARSSATEAWDRLEDAFVHRVARALNALQIPTARDIKELNGRVEALQRAVLALERRAAQAQALEASSRQRGPRPGPKAGARQAGVKKTAVRKASARKAGARAAGVRKAPTPATGPAAAPKPARPVAKKKAGS